MASHAYSTDAPGYGAYQTRTALEDRIEQLIAMLDAFDGDPDLEDDDPGGCEHDGREPDVDDEHVDEDGEGEFRGGTTVAADETRAWGLT